MALCPPGSPPCACDQPSYLLYSKHVNKLYPIRRFPRIFFITVQPEYGRYGGYGGELLGRSSPNPSRTLKTFFHMNRSVIHMTFSGSQRCCYRKQQKRPRGDPYPRSSAEKGAYCGGRWTVTPGHRKSMCIIHKNRGEIS